MSDFTGSNTPIDIRDLWRTPAELYAALDREFHFVGDVAASHANHLHQNYLTAEDDALSPEASWDYIFDNGYLWCNPPYSDITPWVSKTQEMAEGSVGVVMLVPADTSVGWFKQALKDVSEVRFITGGRISFVRSDTGQQVNGNNKGSMLLIWNPMRRGAGLVSFADRDELMNYGRHIISVKQRAA